MRILIVDDNPMNVMVVREMLKKAGYDRIGTAASADEMFRLLGNADIPPQAPLIDLVLLDMMMPGMDGIEACRIMQQTERLRDIPVIMVTAVGDSLKLAEALDAGACDFVTKPINRIELLARIRAALRLKAEKDWHKVRDRRLREELELARQVQAAALPSPVDEPGLSIRGLYKPAEHLAGDWYAWYKIDSNRYGIAIIDAMGHGIASSLVCMFVASALRDAILTQVDPEYVVRELNRRAIQLQFSNPLVQYYFTCLYAVADIARGTLEYVNAGHPPGLLTRGDGSAPQKLDRSCVALGLFDGIQIEKRVLELREGDRLLLYTDGVLESLDAADKWQVEKLLDILERTGACPEQLEKLLFQEPEPHMRQDDRCLIIAEVKKEALPR
ncbi:PP2C family protein-serine/threonine phosphatase [Paenibacillus ginsengarvi]|uniref:Fused response regulator/phosphatase n=1 Tax=Paenibacillus ginsengarvi TaxID=400777 RepID=A0A3B0BDQ1_9BACL|nr:fused response regulator/phosphatase [Paenibacillus ginsengarvi]RKN71253.1 fused response regulator/phosphatase [Paenibacillus ginsengarvi]